MSEQSTQKKKTLTPEQLEKMQEGRKKAMAERRKIKEQIKTEEKEAKIKEKKLSREAEKQKKAEEKAKKEADKKRELEAELQALQQQKDRIESMKKTMESRNKFRARMREKQNKDHLEEGVKVIDEPIDDLEELFELAEEVEASGAVEEEETKDFIHDEEKIFRHTASVLAHNAKPETQQLFNKITGNYDRSKSITENLNDMSNEIKKMIAETLKQVKKNEKVIEKEQPKEDVEQVPLEEAVEEIKYKSNLSSLMKLR